MQTLLTCVFHLKSLVIVIPGYLMLSTFSRSVHAKVQNRSPVKFYCIYNNLLLSEAKKRIYPFQCLATNSIAEQFAIKEFVRGCIKCLFKIQYECVNLSSFVQDFSLIIYYRSQLSFTTMSFPEFMLPIWQEFIFIKMGHDVWTYYLFE